MSEEDSYLWDRTGDPEQLVLELERVLSPLGHDGRPFVPPARRWLTWPRLAAAAVVLLVAGGWAWRGRDEIRLDVAGARQSLKSGEWFTASEHARELHLGKLGRITLDVGSRLQVNRLSKEETHLYLERGRLEARVSGEARPRFFQVATPSANCVDLGCRYTLEVTKDGDSLVHVLTGQVAFQNEGREVYVPAGATCKASKKRGAGTPRFLDTSAPLLALVDELDSAAAGSRREIATRTLQQVRSKHDALVAFHLLQDPDEAVGQLAEQVLQKTLQRPKELAAGRSARSDPAARELWKDAFDECVE